MVMDIMLQDDTYKNIGRIKNMNIGNPERVIQTPRPQPLPEIMPERERKKEPVKVPIKEPVRRGN
tara:strand:- start:121 stop:315 length:195 start_codon:yes stop_codon:yes gene_type:complete